MSTNDSFAIIGLTGGIASGKSTIATMLSELGVFIIDADQIAREIVQPGEPALEDIRTTFGDEVLHEDGSLNREALGDVVFSDESARQHLDAITHPRIATRMMEKAAEARRAGHAWVVYDAALIVENDLHAGLDALIVVAAARDTRIERLIERDDLDEQQAVERLDSQMPQRDKIAVADYVIDNNGTLEETRRQVRILHDHIQRAVAEWGTASPEILAQHDIEVPAQLTPPAG